MTHQRKLDLLLDAMKAVDISVMMMVKAREFQLKGSEVHIQLNAERRKIEPDLTTIQQLKCDRDEYLHVADTYHRSAKKYLRESKKLARKARWMHD